MKRSDLVPGKYYYYNNRADWAGGYYRKFDNKTQTYLYLADSSHRVKVVRTWLETDYERKYNSKEVLVMNKDGKTAWVSLAHIRGTFSECAEAIYNRNKREDDRTKKYEAHLRRKFKKEVHQPTLNSVVSGLKEASGVWFSTYDKFESLPYEVLKVINEALLKTQEKVSA